MKQVLIDAGNRESWNTFVAASPYGHTLQTWEWGEFKTGTGWEALRLALCDERGIRAAAQVLIRRPLPFGFGKVAYVPKGPVLDYADSTLLGQMLDALVRLAANHHVLALKIEPEVVEPSSLGEELRRRGWRDSSPVQMRSTIWVDLSSSEDEILARQKQKTRYNTRLAQRKGVSVSCGTVSDLMAWYDMFHVTARRDGFSIHGLEYYRLALEVLGPPGLARLLLAHHEGDLLAGIIVFRFGRGAQYMYGASSNDKRNLMAPYLLQWEGMRWARQQGAMVYDLWGIPDLLSEDEDLWGVYRHKRGYGGEIVRYVGAFDHVRGRAQQAALERLARPLFK
ncbi:MAG: peptidoglycan bridge formation glycyltransferase FemA/FemB family protein, partial [Chloroflexota bacterium]|nr:peptidoglycan bridge formation glycyltransferase FemA/FemB family protein [Chloroflexota bacterium]